MSKRKQRHEEHPDERWLITYADVLTLMFVLFMVLFSISVVNTAKFEVLKQSLQDAFNSGLANGGESVLEGAGSVDASPVVDTPSSQIAPELPFVGGINLSKASPEQLLETKQLMTAEEKINETVDKAGLEKSVSTVVNERGLMLRVETDGVLFDSGRAVLRPEGARIIGPIAASLVKLPNPIRVEGHTDSRPIGSSQFPNNWALSGVRAAAVVQVLQNAGVPQARLQAAGFGQARPIADNTTEAGRGKNRRVEILVMRLQGAPEQSPATALGG